MYKQLVLLVSQLPWGPRKCIYQVQCNMNPPRARFPELIRHTMHGWTRAKNNCLANPYPSLDVSDWQFSALSFCNLRGGFKPEAKRLPHKQQTLKIKHPWVTHGERSRRMAKGSQSTTFSSETQFLSNFSSKMSNANSSKTELPSQESSTSKMASNTNSQASIAKSEKSKTDASDNNSRFKASIKPALNRLTLLEQSLSTPEDDNYSGEGHSSDSGIDLPNYTKAEKNSYEQKGLFQEYIMKSGLHFALIRAIVTLYEEENKPNDPLSYIAERLGFGVWDEFEIEDIQEDLQDMHDEVEEWHFMNDFMADMVKEKLQKNAERRAASAKIEGLLEWTVPEYSNFSLDDIDSLNSSDEEEQLDGEGNEEDEEDDVLTVSLDVHCDDLPGA